MSRHLRSLLLNCGWIILLLGLCFADLPLLEALAPLLVAVGLWQAAARVIGRLWPPDEHALPLSSEDGEEVRRARRRLAMLLKLQNQVEASLGELQLLDGLQGYELPGHVATELLESRHHLRQAIARERIIIASLLARPWLDLCAELATQPEPSTQAAARMRIRRIAAARVQGAAILAELPPDDHLLEHQAGRALHSLLERHVEELHAAWLELLARWAEHGRGRPELTLELLKQTRRGLRNG